MKGREGKGGIRKHAPQQVYWHSLTRSGLCKRGRGAPENIIISFVIASGDVVVGFPGTLELELPETRTPRRRRKKSIFH